MSWSTWKANAEIEVLLSASAHEQALHDATEAKSPVDNKTSNTLATPRNTCCNLVFLLASANQKTARRTATTPTATPYQAIGTENLKVARCNAMTPTNTYSAKGT